MVVGGPSKHMRRVGWEVGTPGVVDRGYTISADLPGAD